jgi:hypothetical protein
LEDDFAVRGTARTYTPSETKEVTFQFVFPSSAVFDNLLQKPMIRLATEPDSTFEPYHGKTYTTPFNQTVYGGTLDVLTGELTIDKGYKLVSDLTWSYTGNRFQTDIADKKNASSSSEKDILWCSAYEVVAGNDITNGSADNAIGSSVANGRIFLRDSRYTTTSALVSNMGDVQIVYELATPTTIQLTPQKVKSLVGENHISANTGDVTECKFSMLINGDDLEMLLS